MNITYAWAISAVDTVADFVRSALPLQYRHVASNWLIFAFLFALAAVLLAFSHFVFRERPKIAWNFSNVGYPVALGASLATVESPWTYGVDGIQLGGENVSGHDLYQVDGRIELRDGRKLPLFVAVDGAWRPLGELEKIPPRAMLSIGGQFRADGVHWDEFPSGMQIDRFLKEFGGLNITVSIDGTTWVWSYSVDDLRDLIEAKKRAIEDDWFRNPMNRPQVKRKAS
jgi:hypothetical protein